MELRHELVQKPVLTQETKLFVDLLQLPTIDLIQTIKEEMKENPFLEGEIEELGNKDRDFLDLEDEIENLGESYIPDDSSYIAERQKKKNYAESIIKTEETLYEHLLTQLNFLDLSEEEYKIAEGIISLLDEDGFLQKKETDKSGNIVKKPITDEELADILETDIKTIKRVLQKLKVLEPSGIVARDLRESFLIQIENLNTNKEEAKIAKKILENAYEELLDLDIKAISKKIGEDEKKVKEAIKFIGTLEPFPGRKFSPKKIQYIIPDVIVEETEEGFKIYFNNEWLPSLKINKEYKSVLSKLDNSKDKKFLREKYKKALMLLKAIDMRKNTILKVVEAIVEYQEDFFRKGIKYLKPLTLDMVAEKLGINKSTVSRASNGKYLQCKWGIFEIKFFFSTGYQTEKEENTISSLSIKNYIKELISKEDPQKPLKDSEIAKIIKEKKGIDIARRTIAKYREELKILPYNKRKKLKIL